MVVDDQESFRRAARAVIDATPGFAPLRDAASGLEALEFAQDLQPIDVSSGVTPKQFIRGEWFIGVALLTGLIWVVLYWLIVQHGGGSVWWPTGIAFAIGFGIRMLALYRGWEEPLAKEPAGVYKHDDGRPLLGRKIAGKSQRELRDLGLLVENGTGQPTDVEAPPAAAPAH